VSVIISELEYLKICVRCAPWKLAVEYNTKIKAICSDLSACFQAKGKTFYPGLLQELKLGSTIFNQGQNIHGMAPFSSSPEEKI